MNKDVGTESGKTLVIWNTNGNTLFFENVTDFENVANLEGDLYLLKFKYFGVTTQTKRDAFFNQNNIEGFALEE